MEQKETGLYFEKVKKRKLKKGETDYPRYEIKTIGDLFDALTPKNAKKFLREFSRVMEATVHLREAIYLTAKENADKAGVELDLKASDAIKMPSYTWIDD